MIVDQRITREDFEMEALTHLNDLFRTAARSIGNRTEAEDLVQVLREGSTFPCLGPYRDADGDGSAALAHREGVDTLAAVSQ